MKGRNERHELIFNEDYKIFSCPTIFLKGRNEKNEGTRVETKEIIASYCGYGDLPESQDFVADGFFWRLIGFQWQRIG